VNAREQNYETPMVVSTGYGHLEMVKLLVERGADMDAMDGDGDTPYQVSLRFGYREIADLLWKHGAGRLGERFDEILL
jgi:ankyrin repeat protein